MTTYEELAIRHHLPKPVAELPKVWIVAGVVPQYGRDRHQAASSFYGYEMHVQGVGHFTVDDQVILEADRLTRGQRVDPDTWHKLLIGLAILQHQTINYEEI